ncbi:MAG: hypothetical protein AB7O52_15570 [Planctomycetota bacterium]
MNHPSFVRAAGRWFLMLSVGALLALLSARCGGPPHRGIAPAQDPAKAAAAWSVVYEVLQHPRCVNCHPAGDTPLQGDASLPHAQNVQRGSDGQGLFALRCSDCHQDVNLSGAHLPPGAPHWQLPPPDMPLVFQGRSSAELCRQLMDPAQNGGRTLEQLYEHMAHDPLVLWGWSPGDGREPIALPHAEFLAALRSWIDHGCGCPTD